MTREEQRGGVGERRRSRAGEGEGGKAEERRVGVWRSRRM